MKVLVITCEYPPMAGGIGWYAHYLNHELASSGHEITVLVRSSNLPQPFGPFKLANIKAGIIPLVNAHKLIRGVKKYLSVDPHDIAIVHGTTTGAWIDFLPTILVSHCCLAEGQKHLYRGAYDIGSILHVLFKRIYTAVERKSILEARAVGVVSKAMQQEVLRHYGRNVDYVGNAVDSTVFFPSYGVGKRGVLLPSMLRAGKGIREAVQVIKKVRRNSDIPFKFIGAGPMKEWLIKEIARLSLSKVELLEPMEHSKLTEMYKNSSIVFLPSYYEGLPTVALEAAASGLPVVATPAGGTVEAVIDGESGFIHHITDVDGMAESIVRLDESVELRERLGSKGRARILQDFNWKTVGDRFEHIMESLV